VGSASRQLENLPVFVVPTDFKWACIIVSGWVLRAQCLAFWVSILFGFAEPLSVGVYQLWSFIQRLERWATTNSASQVTSISWMFFSRFFWCSVSVMSTLPLPAFVCILCKCKSFVSVNHKINLVSSIYSDNLCFKRRKATLGTKSAWSRLVPKAHASVAFRMQGNTNLEDLK